MNLYEVVNEFAEHLNMQPYSGGKRIQISNDINPGLGIVNGEHILHQLLTNLSSWAEPEEACYIEVNAKLFNKLALVQLKTNIQFDYGVAEPSFRRINEMAGKLGGCLYISSDRPDEHTISYTCLNGADDEGISFANLTNINRIH